MVIDTLWNEEDNRNMNFSLAHYRRAIFWLVPMFSVGVAKRLFVCVPGKIHEKRLV